MCFLSTRSLWETTAIVGVAVSAFILPPSLAIANPAGGVISSGVADIQQTSTNTTITQNTSHIVIEWDSFDLSAGETAQFIQPSSQSIAVNRIHDVDPSVINGNINANGHVVLINQNGVVFGNQARVDVAGLVVSTADIKDTTQLSTGILDLSEAGQDTGIIINHGEITVQDSGIAAFVAPTVINNGVVKATLGKVQLAGADTATVDLYGDGLVELAITNEETSKAVLNSGAISANGGEVLLTARAGKDIVDSIVSSSGVIEANSVAQKNGKIILYAEGSTAVKNNSSANKNKKSGASVTHVSGIISAQGNEENTTGGSIEILGDHIVTNDVIISASGNSGGGDIKIGGDYLGRGETSTAQTTWVTDTTIILNDAIDQGNGGQTIIWSDDTTEFSGFISGRGGKNSGDGGFVETSGKINLKADGFVDLTAQSETGEKGTYLLDPANITVYGNVDPTFVSSDNSINLPTNLALWLDANDAATVTLSYAATGTTASGSIGTNTITLANAAPATYLQAGARIRLGASGPITTADVVGTDTYTIASISGTTITTVESLTNTYTGSTAYKGLVSNWADKAPVASNATQSSAARRPLYISSEASFGDKGAIRFYRNLVNHMDLAPDLNNVAGGYNSIFYTMNWNGGGGMPFGFTTYDPYFAGASFGVNNGAGNVYGVASAPLLNETRQLSMDFFNGVISGNEFSIDGVEQTETFRLGGTGSAKNVTDNMRLGSWRNNTSYTLNNLTSEYVILNKQATVNERNLIEQYQSAKWDIGLLDNNPITEATQAMDATTGYGVFDASYLMRLSNSADIILQASDTISLDLKGQDLMSANNRSITLNAGNNITQTGTGSLKTQGTGSIFLIAGDDVSVSIDASSAVDVNASSASLTGIIEGGIDQMAADKITLSGVATRNNPLFKFNNFTIGRIIPNISSTTNPVQIISSNLNTTGALKEKLSKKEGQEYNKHSGFKGTQGSKDSDVILNVVYKGSDGKQYNLYQ